MTIIFSVFGLLTIILIIGKVILSIQFNAEVRQLFAESKKISGKTFRQEALIGLPEPVQRYFKRVLQEGQPYISYVRITHDGQFKTGLDKNWVNITGEQYATTERPGFIWKGHTALFTARDMYIADKGRLVVSLFSLIKVVDGQGENYDQGESLRWLGESVLYPTNLLPGERLQWSPIDAQSAELTFHYHTLSLFFRVTFNALGEITQMETKRYMDEKNLETWVIKADNYKTLHGVGVPTSFEVLWRLEKGDFPYARFYIQTIEYDKAEKI